MKVSLVYSVLVKYVVTIYLLPSSHNKLPPKVVILFPFLSQADLKFHALFMSIACIIDTSQRST